MNKIFVLKHWQVFIGLMIFPVLNFIFSVVDFPSNIELQAFFGVVGLIIFFNWVLFIGLSLNRLKGNPYHFRNGFLIIAVLFCIFGYGDMHLRALSGYDLMLNESISLILTPMTFVGLIYTFKNVAQSLKSIENGEKAKFKEYIIDAILVFCFPIGVWIIQPRLNKIFKDNFENK